MVLTPPKADPLPTCADRKPAAKLFHWCALERPGCLCVPSLLFGPGGWRSTLACLGALCEVGYEAQDLLLRVVWATTGTHKHDNPPVLMILMILHHSMATSSAVPFALHCKKTHFANFAKLSASLVRFT